MAKVETASAINQVHGKTNSLDSGYFYVRKGKQFYRTREETYQKNQSPRQKWNSKAFAYANSQVTLLLSTPESEAELEAEYKAAKHIAANGKSYTTLRAWKFNSLLHDWKVAHPFE